MTNAGELRGTGGSGFPVPLLFRKAALPAAFFLPAVLLFSSAQIVFSQTDSSYPLAMDYGFQESTAIESGQNFEPEEVPDCLSRSAETARLGTLVDWQENYDEAFIRARHERKPIYVFHLSGNLAHDAFT